MQHLTQDELVLFYYREEAGASRERLRNTCSPVSSAAVSSPHLRKCWRPYPRCPFPSVVNPMGRGCGLASNPAWQKRKPRRWRFSLPAKWAMAGGWPFCWWRRSGQAESGSTPDSQRPRDFPPCTTGESIGGVGDHLERAQMLLVEVMNQQVEGRWIFRRQAIGQDLVQSNGSIRQTAVRDGDPEVASVLDELERVLLQISHSPSQISPEDLASLQAQIAAQGILFKVRVLNCRCSISRKPPGSIRSGIRSKQSPAAKRFKPRVMKMSAEPMLRETTRRNMTTLNES